MVRSTMPPTQSERHGWDQLSLLLDVAAVCRGVRVQFRPILIDFSRHITSRTTAMIGGFFKIILLLWITVAIAYDPTDDTLKDILLPQGEFEAFYLKKPQEEEEGAARPPHLHGSFHQYRNPALVDAPNSAAYGFRFDGKRRFNYD